MRGRIERAGGSSGPGRGARAWNWELPLVMKRGGLHVVGEECSD